MPFCMILSGSVSWHTSSQRRRHSFTTSAFDFRGAYIEKNDYVDIFAKEDCLEWEKRDIGQCIKVSYRGGKS